MNGPRPERQNKEMSEQSEQKGLRSLLEGSALVGEGVELVELVL